MLTPISVALLVAGLVLILLGKRGDRKRLLEVDTKNPVEASLVKKWWTKGESTEYYYWWQVTHSGSGKKAKVKVAASTWEMHDPPAVVTLEVHPRTGRLYDQHLGRRVRFGLQTAGWIVVLVGIVILIGSYGGINSILGR